METELETQPKKPGRRPTGKKRPHIINCLVNLDEDEYIARESYFLGLSKSQLLLRRACRNRWKTRLQELRELQSSVTGSFRK